MPLYFFDTTSCELSDRDEDGVECADPIAARQTAQRALCEMAMHHSTGEDHQTFAVRVRDQAGAVIYRATLQLDGRRRGTASGDVPFAVRA